MAGHHMTLSMLSTLVRSTCQMNRRIVGTEVGVRSILCVVLIISYQEAIRQPTHSTPRNYVCPKINPHFGNWCASHPTIRPYPPGFGSSAPRVFKFPQMLRALAPPDFCLWM